MRKRRRRCVRPLWDHLDDRCLPSGYTPAQITAAYGLNAISFTSSSGTKVTGDGTGQTIALIEMYSDPNIQASLDAFDAAYSLPNITLNVINQAGTQTDSGWAQEESLDVEWAHAIAPGANIVVVEAAPGNTNSLALTNLMTAVQTASQTPGVTVVSMSWGFNEFANEPSYDSNFKTPGITYIASSGDTGNVEWPAASPDVLAVGGTTLNLSSTGSYGSESGWVDTGGGVSLYEPEPNFQDSVQSTGFRSTPDVSFVADPNTGVSVYVISPSGKASWEVVGGTSVGAPAWAGIIAIADQGRAIAGLASLNGATETLPALYSAPSTDFEKVAETASRRSPRGGSNTAINTASYTTQTGLGTPKGASLIQSFVPATTVTTTPTPTPSPTPAPTPTLAALADSGSHTNASTNSYAGARTNSNSSTDSNTNAGTDSNPDPFAHTCSNSSTHTDTGANCDPFAHTRPDAFARAGAGSITDSGASSHPDANPDAKGTNIAAASAAAQTRAASSESAPCR